MSIIIGQQVATCELKTPTKARMSVAKRAPYRVAMATAFSFDPRKTMTRVVVGSCQHKNQTNQYLSLERYCRRARVFRWRPGRTADNDHDHDHVDSLPISQWGRCYLLFNWGYVVITWLFGTMDRCGYLP